MEAWLSKPYWVIDWLPEQVPADGGGSFFAVEAFMLREPRQTALRRRFAELLLRLNCYCRFRVCEPEAEQWTESPPPETLYAWLAEGRKDLCVLLPEEDALITVNRDDLYMTVYQPSERLLRLLAPLAAGAGLFLWQPPQAAGSE